MVRYLEYRWGHILSTIGAILYCRGYLVYHVDVQYHGVILSTMGDILCTLGISVPWDIIIHVWDIISIVGMFNTSHFS